ncbi:MAG: GNAT family N-acetyltransferase, partial [Anaerolineae bacterium]|nr:GNAT family N-acetyltransferase [Anaerolineae bacterium]
MRDVKQAERRDDYIFREVDKKQDVEKLAAMWQASDDQWPGTWSGGTEISPEKVTEWMEREGSLSITVVETADQKRIVGYCSFSERQEEKGVGYVGLLNVQPEYQKKSLARRLLQHSIQRCLDLGFHILTLGTWSGNLKSVPLYKKTGFYWVPDTSVWMLNFVPGILSLPCAKPFFSKHDWYSTMRRELHQVEDDMRWEGMKVFIYEFEENGERLKVWADRESLKITAVETDTFFAGAIAASIEPPKGLPTKIRWRLQNKTDRSMHVSLMASGTEHMKLDYRKTLELQPGAQVELDSKVDISLDTPEVKPRKSVPSMRTVLIIDGEVLELGTGLRPQPAVNVSTAPKHVSLMPGVEKTVNIQLHSYFEQACQVTVRLTAPEGLRTDWTETALDLPGKSWGGVPVKLSAGQAGVYPLQVVVTFDGRETAPETLPVFCMPVNGVLAYKGQRYTRIENQSVRLWLDSFGGGIGIHMAHDDTWLGTVSESLGPPFWPTEFRSKDFAIDLAELNGSVTATMSAVSDDNPGLVLKRRVTLGGGDLAEIETQLVNVGSSSYEL